MVDSYFGKVETSDRNRYAAPFKSFKRTNTKLSIAFFVVVVYD